MALHPITYARLMSTKFVQPQRLLKNVCTIKLNGPQAINVEKTFFRNIWCNGLHFSRSQKGFPKLSRTYLQICRDFSKQYNKGTEQLSSDKTPVIYVAAIGVFMIGMTYAGVPLYRMFCQASGLGGQPTKGHDTDKVVDMKPVDERVIKIRFNADTASSMQWSFRPQQASITVHPGETALAFYTAKNPTDKPIIGISTYNVVPFEAGIYFNKIQCFCFEEQRLNPHEQVDMPVFFYIDPEFAEDPKLEGCGQITLSYTFFEAKEGMNLPLPGYMQPQKQAQTH